VGRFLPPHLRHLPLQVEHPVAEFGVFFFEIEIVLDHDCQQVAAGLLAAQEQLLALGHGVQGIGQDGNGRSKGGISQRRPQGGDRGSLALNPGRDRGPMLAQGLQPLADLDVGQPLGQQALDGQQRFQVLVGVAPVGRRGAGRQVRPAGRF